MVWPSSEAPRILPTPEGFSAALANQMHQAEDGGLLDRLAPLIGTGEIPWIGALTAPAHWLYLRT